MRLDWLMIGALGAAASIGLGAFGAHGLRARLDAEALVLWETSARYLMYASLGLGLIGLVERQAPGATGLSGALLAAGGALFSSTVALLALDGPRWLGAVTPIGGILMIAGWLVLAWGAFSAR
jgi:uncharacterized membrane protein YgdD (TMEM256/DUF423 family)